MPYPLDDYTANLAAVYFTRRMLTSYTGALIRVRRSSDSTELDIGANADGSLDTDALTTFAGAGDAYVVSFYDQAGGTAATAPSAGAQPPIVVSGTLQTMGVAGSPIPAPLFNGTTHQFRADHLAAGLSGDSSPATFLGVVQDTQTNAVEGCWFGAGAGTTTPTRFGHTAPVSGVRFLRYFARDDAAAIGFNTRSGGTPKAEGALVSVVDTGATVTHHLDGAARITYNQNLGVVTLDRAGIGALVRNTTTQYWKGSIAGVVVWGAAVADALTIHEAVGTELGLPPWSATAPMGGAWTWFNSPAAIKSGTSTYVGTVRAGDIVVGEWQAGTFAGSQPANIALQVDDHNNPAFLARSDGRILVNYSWHDDVGESYTRLSDGGTLLDWLGPEVALGTTKRSYAILEQLSSEAGTLGGAIHQFYRDKTGATEWRRIKSTDGGVTWGSPASAISCVYLRAFGDGDSRIHFGINLAHPVSGPVNATYHCYYEAGNWYQSDGTLVGSDAALPIDPTATTLVYDSATTGLRSWVWDVWADPVTGHPVLAYAVFESTTDHRYYVSRWNGSAWATTEVATGGNGLYAGQPYYSGGIAIYDANTMFVSREVSSQWEIWRYDWDGAAWNGTAITSSSAAKNIRPVVPRVAGAPGTAPGEVYYLNGTYTSFADYSMDVVRLEVESPGPPASALNLLRSPFATLFGG